MRSKVTPRKVVVGLKRRRELNKRRLAWWGSTEKKEASYLLGLRESTNESCFNCSQLINVLGMVGKGNVGFYELW